VKILYAIVTCERRSAQAQAQRESWVNDVANRADVRFFLARQKREALADEVYLNVGDDYEHLPAKVRETTRWALEHSYSLMLKLDDDVVLFPSRVILPRSDYAGLTQHSGRYDWCAGMTYWLRERAMQVVATSELTDDPFEDRWIGTVLGKVGIRGQRDDKIRVVRAKAASMPHNLHAQLAQCYAAGEFTASELSQVYR
jgi:hypothetical protein